MGIHFDQTYTKYTAKMNTGRYHALFIALDQYQELEPLCFSVRDIEALERVLGEAYGVRTLKKLINQEASHTRIRQALLETEKLSAEDTLLMVFSGQGRTDNTDGMNFWLPYDAESDAIDRGPVAADSECDSSHAENPGTACAADQYQFSDGNYRWWTCVMTKHMGKESWKCWSPVGIWMKKTPWCSTMQGMGGVKSIME
jgi:hypothetical protein